MVDTTGHSTFAKDRGPSTATSQARPDPPPTIVSGAGALEILRSRTYVQRQVNRGRPPPDYEEAPMSKQRSIPVIRSWRPVGPSLSAAALRTPHRHCSVAPPTVPAAGVPAAPGPPLSCRGGPLPYRGGDGRPVPRRPLRYWQAAGQVRTTGRWSSIGAAVLAVTALVLASAPADAACDAGDRISHRDSMCLRASWDNEGLPGFHEELLQCPEHVPGIWNVGCKGRPGGCHGPDAAPRRQRRETGLHLLQDQVDLLLLGPQRQLRAGAGGYGCRVSRNVLAGEFGGTDLRERDRLLLRLRRGPEMHHLRGLRTDDATGLHPLRHHPADERRGRHRELQRQADEGGRAGMAAPPGRSRAHRRSRWWMRGCAKRRAHRSHSVSCWIRQPPGRSRRTMPPRTGRLRPGRTMWRRTDAELRRR